MPDFGHVLPVDLEAREFLAKQLPDRRVLSDHDGHGGP